jgi:hypothetical protein
MSRISSWCDRHLVVSPYYIALCLTHKAFKRELKHLNVPPNLWPNFQGSSQANATVHYFARKAKRSAIVCLGPTKNRSGIEVCGLLTHEAVHIWQAICDELGERNPSPEFEAYSIQAISQELWTKFSELKGKFK